MYLNSCSIHIWYIRLEDDFQERGTKVGARALKVVEQVLYTCNHTKCLTLSKVNWLLSSSTFLPLHRSEQNESPSEFKQWIGLHTEGSQNCALLRSELSTHMQTMWFVVFSRGMYLVWTKGSDAFFVWKVEAPHSLEMHRCHLCCVSEATYWLEAGGNKVGRACLFFFFFFFLAPLIGSFLCASGEESDMTYLVYAFDNVDARHLFRLLSKHCNKKTSRGGFGVFLPWRFLCKRLRWWRSQRRRATSDR